MNRMSINELDADLLDGIGDREKILDELRGRIEAGIEAITALEKIGKGWQADIARINTAIEKIERILARYN